MPKYVTDAPYSATGDGVAYMDNSGKILGRGKINNWKGQGSYITN